MSKHNWECDECGTQNEISEAVIELCAEYWGRCKECGERQPFNFAGETVQ